MKTIFIILTFALSLIACSSGNSDGSGTVQTDDKVKGIFIVGSGTNHWIDENVIYDLTVTGSNDIVLIKGNNELRKLAIVGSNNMFTISDNVTIEQINATGSDNTLSVPVGSGFAFHSNTGSGNQIIEQ